MPRVFVLEDLDANLGLEVIAKRAPRQVLEREAQELAREVLRCRARLEAQRIAGQREEDEDQRTEQAHVVR